MSLCCPLCQEIENVFLRGLREGWTGLGVNKKKKRVVSGIVRISSTLQVKPAGYKWWVNGFRGQPFSLIWKAGNCFDIVAIKATKKGFTNTDLWATFVQAESRPILPRLHTHNAVDSQTIHSQLWFVHIYSPVGVCIKQPGSHWHGGPMLRP